ncbi:MAG: hypothetical protein H0S79_24635 [Anaerolineaceae bacterium]|nr:hypothetical protein [Anaerolineaceae bacterium]
MLNSKNNSSIQPSENTPTTDQAACCTIQPGVSLQAGMICPRCGQAVIDYDGLLQLVCPNCGLKEAGACT